MGPTPTTVNAEFTAFAPGRVNLIGEHTDYNGGCALPFAIGAGVWVTARPGHEAGTLVAEALDVGESDTFAIANPAPAPGWRAFVRGVVAELAATGVQLRGGDLSIRGNVPRGAGLSSSAALEVSLCLSLLALAGAAVPEDLALAALCSRVENKWVGAESGLLDQLTSICATPDHALLIDFQSLSVSPVPLELGAYTLIAVDSGQQHALHESGYNTRRQECEQACVALGVASLRDATPAAAAELPEPLNRRVRHVSSENARVGAAVAALADGDLEQLGALLNASHASLRDDYEVSTDAVEATVRRLLDYGAIGARIVGGGFGGSVLALLGPGLEPPAGAMVLEAGAGARLLSDTDRRP